MMTAREEPAGLSLDGVRITLEGRTIAAVTATVPPGTVLTLMGPSGVGKSSLLAYLSGSLAPAFRAGGAVWLNGRRIDGLPPHERRVGMLYQDDLLFPHLSVAGNLGFGLAARVRGRAARRAAIEAALDSAGLAGFGPRDPATLSGGQRARVSLLRVLLSEPEALLLDEPFGKLDAALRDQFRTTVFQRARAAGLPVLLVTHDAADAAAAGGRLITLAENGASG